MKCCCGKCLKERLNLGGLEYALKSLHTFLRLVVLLVAIWLAYFSLNACAFLKIFLILIVSLSLTRFLFNILMPGLYR